MESTCSRLLEYCLRGEEWPPELLDQAIAIDDGRVLLSVVVERLADLFEPSLCRTYEALFTRVIERVAPELGARIREGPGAHSPPRSVQRVYVLSRVTLGADVAVTSVLLDTAKKRYPEAEIVFVGPQKSYELFEADPRVKHCPAPYARGGSLAERLRASASLWFDDGIVIDPDSRLSQLGLISVCGEERYFWFQSRSYGGDGEVRLPDLASQWAREIFSVTGARSYVAPKPASGVTAQITVSLGTGDNSQKGLGRDFEKRLLSLLAGTGKSVLIDMGGSAEERTRVENALVPGIHTHDGSFASFASHIQRSELYVGYDSSGGHVASAGGIPLISIFTGEASERMFQRWRPNGNVIRSNFLAEVERALTYTFRR